MWPGCGKCGQRSTGQKHFFLFNNISIQVTQTSIVRVEVVIFFETWRSQVRVSSYDSNKSTKKMQQF